jgi:hypothetical protein
MLQRSMSGERIKYSKRLGRVKHNLTPADDAADTLVHIYLRALSRVDRRDL